jgi:hypothetical protein
MTLLARHHTRIAAAVLVAAALATPAPAQAEDNGPPSLPGSCSDGIGTLTNGTVVGRRRDLPPMPGTLGLPGLYVCVDGQWIYIGNPTGPGGPIFMEGAPTVTADDSTVTVEEGSTAANTGIATYADATAITLGASPGAISGQGVLWSWSLPTTDGPAQSQSVTVTGAAAGKVGGTTFDLVVENVAPTVQSVSPDATTVIAGRPVTFTGVATDPSSDDAQAGFSWAFDGTAATGPTYTRSFPACGRATVTATATDKDGATSAPATSTAVDVVQASFAAPLSGAGYNLVRAGQVVPVRLQLGCGATAATGLSPSIQLLNGDVDPATDADDPASLVPTTDARADTGSVMRPAGGAYLYNLRVPIGVPGSLFTVRIRPFAGDTTAVYAVLQLRG